MALTTPIANAVQQLDPRRQRVQQMLGANNPAAIAGFRNAFTPPTPQQAAAARARGAAVMASPEFQAEQARRQQVFDEGVAAGTFAGPNTAMEQRVANANLPMQPAPVGQPQPFAQAQPFNRQEQIQQMLRSNDPRAISGLRSQLDAAAAPQTGVIGAEQAITEGTTGAISALEELLGQARGEIATGRERALTASEELFERGVQPLEQLQTGAAGAQQQQAALSGALGPEAQAAAIAEFQDSPQQAFLREQGERAIIRNAAALGGLGGGNVRKELLRFGTGLAAQDFANQFSRLGDVAGRGLSAAGTAAGLGAGEAGRRTGIETAATEGTAGLLAGQGRDIASILGGQGGALANIRSQAGRDLASAISGTTQGLANLSDQQGQVLQGIFGEGAADVANIMNAAGQGDAAAQERLAQLLSNLNTNEATLLANLFAGQGTARLTGDIAAADRFSDVLSTVGKALPI